MTTVINSKVKGPSHAQRLIDTKIFDPEYYAAQCDRTFNSPMLAAVHFLQFGMKANRSVHPLIDLSYFSKMFRDKYQGGNVEFLLAYLKSAASREHLWSPVFDPKVLDDGSLSSTRLLSNFRHDTNPLLPVPADFIGTAPSWSEARAVIIGHARTSASYVLAKKPLRYTNWPAEAEADWISSMEIVPNIDVSLLAPKVSIIMPAYNRACIIRTAIDSVRNQSLSSWELIIVDDGSTDQTREVVREYSLMDDRIRLIESNHKGVCSARNIGIRNAKGKYLAFLDSDNTWRPNFLNLMIAGLSSSSSKAAYCAIHMTNKKEEYTGRPVDSTNLLIRNYVDLNVLVAETDLIKGIDGFDEGLRRWVDHDLVLRIIKESPISYFPFVGCDYSDDDNDNRITRSESSNWQYAVLAKNIVTWIGPDSPQIDGIRSDISVIFHISENSSRALANLRCLFKFNGVKASDIVIIEDISDPRKSLRLRAALIGLPGLQYIKLPRQYTRAIAFNIGAFYSHGDNLFFLKDGVEIRPNSLARLLLKFDNQNTVAVQPLIVDSAGVVLSGGSASYPNSPAVPLFRGLAIEDALRHSGTGLDELSSAAFLIRSKAFRKVGGLNPIFEGESAFSDLFNRLTSAEVGSLLADPTVIVVDHNDDAWLHPSPLLVNDLPWLSLLNGRYQTVSDHYREIGLDAQTFVAPQFQARQPLLPVAIRPSDTVGKSLRWAIKIGADFTLGGDRWGDVPYARDLAEALRSKGQEVVVDRVNAFSRPSNHLDDVVLVIRGLHPCSPQPGKINILWVISRPDLITREEVQQFDVVYAASLVWCDYAAHAWGIQAIYLPQATNQNRFYPPNSIESENRYDVTFVGGPRKPVGRKVVSDCIAVGQDVSVWGSRWHQFIPEQMVVADFVSNDELVKIYQSSRIVLNDHFADMAKWGFANNRLYDAVASGARVISDEVDGISEIFKGAVQTYASLDELSSLLSDPSAFPDDEEILKISRHIRELHNFDQRAQVFIDHVTSLSHVV